MPQAAPQGVLSRLKQSNRPRRLGWVAQAVPQAGLLWPLRQSNSPPLFLAVVQPPGAQLTGVVQTGLDTGAQTDLGAHPAVPQAGFLSCFKQSNKPPRLGWLVQPGAQLTGAAQAGAHPAWGAQLVPQADLSRLKQSNRPPRFLVVVQPVGAQVTGQGAAHPGAHPAAPQAGDFLCRRQSKMLDFCWACGAQPVVPHPLL